MTKRAARYLLLACGISSPAFAQTTINGSTLALQSSGAAAAGSAWTLGSDGYVGTYINLSQPAAVSFAVSADGTTSNGLTPDMTLSIADSSQSFNVTNTSLNNYNYTTPVLPPGTYFVRTQLDNQSATQTPTLTVGSLTVAGAGVTVLNSNSTTNAMNAATSYAANFRAGSATLSLTNANGIHLGAGTQVQLKLVSNAFDFAGAVYAQSPFSQPPAWLNYNTSTGLNMPPVTSEQINYQKAITTNFNMIVPSNAGKWQNDEFTQGSVNMTVVDAMTDFAQQNGLGVRMHNVIWNNQQPSFVSNLFSSTGTLTAANKSTLVNDINSRLNYYIAQNNVPLGAPRADSYAEMDVMNEPFNGQSQKDNYYGANSLGPAGVAAVYATAAQIMTNVGANTTLYVNEYNILQFSPASVSSKGVGTGNDPYANWYLHGIQQMQQDGGSIGGIGMELYTSATANIVPSQMQDALQNMSVDSGPNGKKIQLALTEFGVASPTNGPTQANYDTDLFDALTMDYGTPSATTFGFWGGIGGPSGAQQDTSNGAFYSLYDSNYNLTPAGQTYQQWMNQFNTNLTLTTDANGNINFNGTYGLYDLTVGGLQYQLDLEKGTANYGLMTPIGAAIWSGAGSDGNWLTSANWTPALAANAPLTFAGTTSLAPNNNSPTGTEYAGITFSSGSASFSISGNSVNLAGDVANNSTSLQSLILPLVLQQNTNFNAASGDLAVGGAISGPFGLTKIGSHTLTLSGSNTYSGPTTVNAGAMILAGPSAVPATTTLTLNNASLLQLASGTGPQNVSALSVSPTATVDVTNNALAINFTGPASDPAATIIPLLASGYNAGSWTGAGITSTTAAANPGKFALGYADGNTDLGTPAAPNQFLIAYTLAADATLDGSVGFADLVVIAQNFGFTGRDWSQGNLNYDPSGSVGFADLVLVAQEFGMTTPIASGPAGPMVLSPLWQAATGQIQTTALPEPRPASMAILLVAGTLARRRRRSPA